MTMAENRVLDYSLAFSGTLSSRAALRADCTAITYLQTG